MEIKTVKLQCSECKKEIEQETVSNFPNYALNKEGNMICFSCCAEIDRQYMRDNERITLYLDESNITKKVTNWHGSLEFIVIFYRIGKHNICGKRIDFWFNFEGFIWHGVQMGDFNQIAHCKRTKNRTQHKR